MNPHLKPAELRMLQAMRAEPDHFAMHGGQHMWVGLKRFSHLTALGLKRLCLIRQDRMDGEYWELTGEGKEIMDDASYVPRILRLNPGLIEAKR